MEGCFMFQWSGEGRLLFRWGASFLNGGGGRGIGFNGGGIRKKS